MDFKQWYSEGVWGQLSYRVPKDKETQLYDFYMLSALLHSPRTSNIPYGGIDEKISQTTKEIASQLFPPLKESLLDAVFYGITVEIRHIFRQNDDKEIYDFIKKNLGENYVKAFKNYENSLGTVDAALRRRAYNTSNKAALNSGLSKKEFVNLCLHLFDAAKNNYPDGLYWSRQFGGKAWANISEAWLKLEQASELNEMMIWIDHVYDLQHNTNVVFNKVSSWAKEGGYRWLTNALILKANIKSPHEIWDKVSSTMRQISAPTIKHYWGKTLEDFEKTKVPPVKLPAYNPLANLPSLETPEERRRERF